MRMFNMIECGDLLDRSRTIVDYMASSIAQLSNSAHIDQAGAFLILDHASTLIDSAMDDIRARSYALDEAIKEAIEQRLIDDRFVSIVESKFKAAGVD